VLVQQQQLEQTSRQGVGVMMQAGGLTQQGEVLVCSSAAAAAAAAIRFASIRFSEYSQLPALHATQCILTDFRGTGSTT
jgi:hypothetical protein